MTTPSIIFPSFSLKHGTTVHLLHMTSLGTSGRSELGRTSCSWVPRRWSACPRREIPFFRNRRGYCCTNALVECSLMLEGLAGQAASTGRRTGSCCCSCCRSAISVDKARWSGTLELTQCWTVLLNCLLVPPDSSSTLSPGRCVTLLLPILLASARFCRGVGWGVEGSRLEAWMKSHKSEVAIT